MTPPDNGNIVPSAAKHKAISRTITAPMAQDKTAAGPAIVAALRAPKSHLDPTKDPTPAKSRPSMPMSLRIPEPGIRSGG